MGGRLCAYSQHANLHLGTVLNPADRISPEFMAMVAYICQKIPANLNSGLAKFQPNPVPTKLNSDQPKFQPIPAKLISGQPKMQPILVYLNSGQFLPA